MKKILLVGMMLTVFFAASAKAQVSFDGAVSFGLPTSDFGDSFEPGFGIGGDLFYQVSSIPNLGLGGRLAWNRFNVDDGALGVNGGNMSIIEILPSARYYFYVPDSQFNFFGQAGLGIYMWSSTIETVGRDFKDDGNDFGFCLGGGVSGKFTDTMSFVAMPLYHIISTENDKTTYLSLNFGIIF